MLDADPDTILCYAKTKLVESDERPIKDYEDNLHLVDPSPRIRFNQLLNTIGLCHAHLGITRRSAMKRTRLIGRQLASDVHYLAELSLYGKFQVVPEYLFYRRYHTQSSSWNRADAKAQQAYYAPKKKGLRLQSWRKFWILMSAVWRAPMPARDRIGLTADVARMGVWERGALVRELGSLVVPGR